MLDACVQTACMPYGCQPEHTNSGATAGTPQPRQAHTHTHTHTPARRADVVNRHRAVLCARRELAAVGRERQAGDAARLRRQHAHAGARGRLPEPQAPVAAARGEVVAVGVPRHDVHVRLVACVRVRVGVLCVVRARACAVAGWCARLARVARARTRTTRSAHARTPPVKMRSGRAISVDHSRAVWSAPAVAR
jgi:hypothetical protein